MTEWHDVETEAPPDQVVLTLWDGINTRTGQPARHYAVGFLADDGQWQNEDGDILDTPTHWTILPEPPTRL